MVAIKGSKNLRTCNRFKLKAKLYSGPPRPKADVMIISLDVMHISFFATISLKYKALRVNSIIYI